jgi:flagellar biosynthesis protein FlhG
MGDQAERLRQTVYETTLQIPDRARRQLVALMGGQAGAGTSTLAINVAVSIARRGTPVIMADLNPRNPTLADDCRLHPKYSLTDVLNRRKHIGELMQVGPCGVKILTCGSGVPASDDAAVKVVARLLDSLAPLAQSHHVVVDAGYAGAPWISSVCQHATQLAVVTTETPESVMQSYAIIKHMCAIGTSSRLSVLVNQSSGSSVAQEVQSRLVLSCHRFLNLHLERCGWVPFDERIPQAARMGRPFVVYAPQTQTAHQINSIGQRFESGSLMGWSPDHSAA